jgi:CxxC motif-containing protein (DUF1111 family)
MYKGNRVDYLIIAIMFFGLSSVNAADAPVGTGQITNGYLSQGDFDSGVALFNLVQTPATGLGPIFNDVSCGNCHHAPSVGGGGAVRGHRAGIFDGTNFIDPPGGSLIDTRALVHNIIPVVPANANVQAFRSTPSALGDGYVEAVPDSTLISIANAQPAKSGGRIHGIALQVPVLEASGVTAIGRFGWKSQHASLLSFSADAFRNEMGITTPLFSTELTSNGKPIDAYEPAGFFSSVANRSDNGDLIKFANFMRSTLARPRAPGSPPFNAPVGVKLNGNAQVILSGQQTFSSIGCDVCHVPSLATAPAGTPLFGGSYVVPTALGGLTFYPFGDYLLHDVGTGDGIVQNGGQLTRNTIRTAPLWGLGKRKAYLHDDSVLTIPDAILKHGGEASYVIQNYQQLSPTDQQNLLVFLQSL